MNAAMKIEIGNEIRDNDPRVGDRVLRVVALSGSDHVFARRVLHDGSLNDYPKKGFRISIKRIHTDGKPRRGGFDLLQP